jgi:hypothetical protein
VKYKYLVLLILLPVIKLADASTNRHQAIRIPAGNTQIITECLSPVGFNESLQQASLADVGLESIETYLRLVKTGDRYDITLTSAEGKQWSAGEDGLTLEPVLYTATNIHMVLKRGSAMEHFLFVLDLSGKGELMWSSAQGSALTTCNAKIF